MDHLKCLRSNLPHFGHNRADKKQTPVHHRKCYLRKGGCEIDGLLFSPSSEAVVASTVLNLGGDIALETAAVAMRAFETGFANTRPVGRVLLLVQ
jgi:hypothetical protein